MLSQYAMLKALASLVAQASPAASASFSALATLVTQKEPTLMGALFANAIASSSAEALFSILPCTSTHIIQSARSHASQASERRRNVGANAKPLGHEQSSFKY